MRYEIREELKTIQGVVLAFFVEIVSFKKKLIIILLRFSPLILAQPVSNYHMDYLTK